MALESLEKQGEIPMAFIGQAKIPRAKHPKARLKQRAQEAHEARRAPLTSVAVKKAATKHKRMRCRARTIEGS